MEVNNYLSKFKLLLDNLIDGKILLNDIDATNLLKFLDDHNENSLGKQILDDPSFTDLILYSLSKIHNTNTFTKVFIIKIVTILFKNELQFTKMQLQGFQRLFCNTCILADLDNMPPPDLHLACIELITTESTHRSGLSIIIQNKAWLSVFYPQIHHKTKQISKAAYNCIAKLVWKLNECNVESVLIEVLEYITKPIFSSEYLNVLLMDSEKDAVFFDKIVSSLNALLAVLTEADNQAPLNKVTSLLKEHFRVEESLHEIFGATKNQDLLKLLNSCLIRYYLQIHRYLLHEDKIGEFCSKMVCAHRDYILRAVKKREAFVIVDFVIQYNIIWSHFENTSKAKINFPLSYEKNGKAFELSIQTIVHLLVPLIKYFLIHRVENQLGRTDAIQQFISKIGKNITDCVYLCCYLFAMTLDERCTSYRKKVTTHTLKELLRLIKYLNETQAGIVFQTLYYLLEMFILCDGAGGLVMIESPMDPDDLRLLSHLLNAMKTLLKEHNIPWYENLEIINIQADLLNLLKQTFLTTKLVVQVLDLIDVCVNRFISPNMSLLVEDNIQESTLIEIGHVIKLYIQHEDWEVRDSALNLLKTCTEISYIKYIPLQKVIRANNLIILASKVALADPEFYSQCIALQCLTAATKNELVWQEVLADNRDLYMQLVLLLKTHGEGMVRKETVNILTGVYASQKVPSCFLNTLYEVMLSAAIDDLHWEVQLAALNFWKCAIQNQLAYRGMIDGKFPSVTFSKEKRKIITLNNVEIQKQLTAVMEHLSKIGCLTVLLECMNKLNHTEVMQSSYRMAKDLIEMLEIHKYEMLMSDSERQSLEKPSQPMEEDNITLIDLTYGQSEEHRNKIIDSILSLNQSELIIRLHDNLSDKGSSEMDLDVTYSSPRDFVLPNKFLAKLRQNNYYNKIIEGKTTCTTDCSSTLDGLLNEILGI